MTVPAGYRVIAEMEYAPAAPERGYTGTSLYVDVGNGAFEARPVTEQMKDLFVGGKGFGLWRLWNAVDATSGPSSTRSVTAAMAASIENASHGPRAEPSGLR